MCLANERQCYFVMSSLIGWAHTQNDPCISDPHWGEAAGYIYCEENLEKLDGVQTELECSVIGSRTICICFSTSQLLGCIVLPLVLFYTVGNSPETELAGFGLRKVLKNILQKCHEGIFCITWHGTLGPEQNGHLLSRQHFQMHFLQLKFLYFE